jgi:hypothetical protein
VSRSLIRIAITGEACEACSLLAAQASRLKASGNSLFHRLEIVHEAQLWPD